MFPMNLDVSPEQQTVTEATRMKGIQLLFSSLQRTASDAYNSFLRKVVGMEGAL